MTVAATPDDREALARDGFLVREAVFAGRALAELREAVEASCARVVAAAATQQ
jgi:hypothetical protein